MKDLLIVDGYNVINSLACYRAPKVSDLETARVKLVEDLANLRARTGWNVVVVFDAGGVPLKRERKTKILGVEVVFTKANKTADSLIERLAFGEVEKRRVTVVTSDYLQQRVVFGKGVHRKTAGELKVDVESARQFGDEVARKLPRLFLEERLDAEVREALRKMSCSG